MAEFKIITGGTSLSTKIFVDDEQIGLIQDINFSASACEQRSFVYITFPSFSDIPENLEIIKKLNEYVKKLEQFDFVQIRYMKIK